ncbi:hypothetical protein [Sphingobacterium puteale]|uniref:hypothetical protein n=1 Tax=Sphingobacterium puteale TaxID=2420510 RepID=UPI003D96392F
MANQLLIKNTMADIRALSNIEITGLQNNTYDGVQLLGYYLPGDTPAPIIYYLSSTTAVDNGGNIIAIGTIKLEHKFIGRIDPKYFGLKPFDKDIDNGIILQRVFDYLSSGNQLATSNGLVQKIDISEGKYYFITPVHLNKHNIHLSGNGSCVFCATDSFPRNTTNGILNLGTNLDCKNIRIDNICFTVDGGNPNDNYQGKFGTGEAYDYSNSILGLRVDNSHYYLINNCTFVGLRLGIWLRGAYAGKIENCQFQWNNRHVQAVQVTGRNNNWVNFTYCVFGNSIVNGGIMLIECVNVSFSFCDIEQSFTTGLVTKGCRGISLENMHLEKCGKYSGRYDQTSFHYSDTPYVSGSVTDNVNTNYDGYYIADDASLNSYMISNSTFAVPTENNKGFLYQRGTRIKMVLQCCILAASAEVTQAFQMLNEYIGISRGYHLQNCSIRQPGLLGSSPLILVEDSTDYSSYDYNRSNIFYVDMVNGDDRLDADKITEETPIKTLASLTNWIPKNTKGEFTIYVKSPIAGRKFINASFNNGGALYINQTDSISIGTICLLTGSRGTLTLNDIIGSAITDYIFESTALRDTNRSNGLDIYINNTVLNSSENFGVINLNFYRSGNSRLYLRDSEVNWSGTNAGIPVRNGLDLYLENVKTNKAISLNGVGNIYYKNVNIIPTKSSSSFGRIVEIQ